MRVRVSNDPKLGRSVDVFPFTLWQHAAGIDLSLDGFERYRQSLDRKELRPRPFAWDRLYGAMIGGEAAVFKEFPVAVRPFDGKSHIETLVAQIVRGAEDWPRVLPVWVGRRQERAYLGVREIIRRWTTATEIVGVTDLAVRGTSVKRRIDTTSIDRLNVLVSRKERILEQEMLTLVVSSAGHFSDSHSDDPDGWNHCVAGCKLWLIWETFEGLANGLEDVERTGSQGPARFDIGTFAGLRSARWFVVERGHSLFLPGSYTHKVITLERYIGFGSFIVFLPGYLATLLRWRKYGALWELEGVRSQRRGLVDEISRAVTGRVRWLARRPLVEQMRAGLPYLQRAVKQWNETADQKDLGLLNEDEASASFLQTVLKGL